MKPLLSYADVKRPRKPKPRKGVKQRNAARGGHRFPKLVVPELREFVRRQPCLMLGLPMIDQSTPHRCWEPVQCAHVKARGTGAPDWDNVVPLCGWEHRALHVLGRKTWEYMRQVRLAPAARKVTAAFLKAYPEMRKRRAGVPPEGAP